MATSPSVNVMNSQGEWQFSSQGADAETEFETVIYASETDSTTYRILDEGQYMSIVSAEDAQGSKVESFWTLRVTDRPKVCENAPATACTTSSDCSSGGTCGVRERSARISFFSFNYSEYSPRITYTTYETLNSHSNSLFRPRVLECDLSGTRCEHGSFSMFNRVRRGCKKSG